MSNLLKSAGKGVVNAFSAENAILGGPTNPAVTPSNTLASGTTADAPALPTPPASITNPNAPQAPAALPTPDATSPAIMEAIRRAQRSNGLSRAATIFTSSLGGGRGGRPSGTADFSKTTLGAG